MEPTTPRGSGRQDSPFQVSFSSHPAPWLLSGPPLQPSDYIQICRVVLKQRKLVAQRETLTRAAEANEEDKQSFSQRRKPVQPEQKSVYSEQKPEVSSDYRREVSFELDSNNSFLSSQVILILTKLYDFHIGSVTESTLWR